MKEKSEIIAMRDDMMSIYSNIWACEYNEANDKMAKMLPKVTETIVELIEIVEKLKNYGVDIPTDIILGQLNNLMNTYERKDYVGLSDTLRYEICDSLNLYIEIIEELKKEKIQL